MNLFDLSKKKENKKGEDEKASIEKIDDFIEKIKKENEALKKILKSINKKHNSD